MAEAIPVLQQTNLHIMDTERDLNDVFDSITCLESTTLDEGYRQGIVEGQKESSVNGFVIGVNTGSSVSLELGYCQAFCASILQLAPKNCPYSPHVVEMCKQVIDKVKSFPTKNVETEDMLTKTKEIKSQLDRIKFTLNKQSNDNIATPPTPTPTQKYSF